MDFKVLNTFTDELLALGGADDCVAPTFAEIAELARVDGVDLRIGVVVDGGSVVACAPCYVRERRHHGLRLRVYALFGGMLHDYLRVYVQTVDAGRILLEGLRKDAREFKCDIVLLDSIISSCVPDGLLKSVIEKKLFDARTTEKGWSEIYARKSAKRFINDAKKQGEYHVEVVNGDVPLSLMQELRALHVRRWAFAGSESAFAENDKRIAEYKCLPSNKHYLRVMLGEEILACHYGMRYGNVLLWHTPVINPKYMSLSPLRVLLAETARWCEANGVDVLDFGLGDEGYKDGYCVGDRVTSEYHRPLTVKGRLAEVIGYAYGHGGCKLMGAVIDVLRSARNALRHWREKWYYYESKCVAEVPADDRVTVAANWRVFCDLMANLGEPVLAWQYDRFKNDSSVSFVALVEDDKLLSYGWTTVENRSLLNGHECSGATILYDFVTPESKRGKGFYTRLLKALIVDGHYVIYVNPKNTPSRRAIEKVGFVRYA